jgi:thymidylate synthase
MNNEFKNLQEAFLDIISSTIKSKEVNSRGFKQRESLFQSFSIDDPTDINIDVPDRKFSQSYAISEWLWYLSADPDVKNIGKLASIWNQIADENNHAESNYGKYIIPQWEWIKQELLSDRDSRRATIVINQPYHKKKNKKDYPCTHYIQFFVRDNQLHCGVNMRSNDAVFGLCNDVFTFCLFQQLLLNELNELGMNISLGKYYHFAGSMHIYERHYAMSEKIIKNGPYDNPKERFTLSEGISLKNCPVMPIIDLEKEGIKKYSEHAKKVIFNEYS